MILSSDQNDTNIQSYTMHNPLIPLFSLLVGGSGLKHLLLLVLFLCLGTPGIATNTDNTIQRINYGIIFEKSTNIFLGQENWLHTFQIQLPKNIHLDSLYCNMPKCKTVGHIIKSINLLRMQCMASVNTTVNQIHHLILYNITSTTNIHWII